MTRQFELVDGEWRDVWNDCPAEAWPEFPPLFEMIVGVCGCVAPNIAELLDDYLTPELDGMIRLDGSTERLLIATIADMLDFTEHGSSLSVAWLTDRGKAWRALRESER